jgi:hypothetical protein
VSRFYAWEVQGKKDGGRVGVSEGRKIE